MSTRHHTIRCFIAVPLPADVQTALAEFQQTLFSRGVLFRPVKPGTIHLTLRFLGDRSAKRVKQIRRDLPVILKGLPALSLTFDKLGAFPSPDNARVLWVGSSQSSDPLNELFNTLNNGLARGGIPKERRPFAPHLTLGRCKTPSESVSVRAVLNDISLPPLTVPVKYVVFYQSTLTADGAVYSPLSSAELTQP
ncbi:MAG: RNA 2',3'-cyclic phosphodiesterase [Candidatus Omnitrophota bacterium]